MRFYLLRNHPWKLLLLEKVVSKRKKKNQKNLNWKLDCEPTALSVLELILFKDRWWWPPLCEQGLNGEALLETLEDCQLSGVLSAVPPQMHEFSHSQIQLFTYSGASRVQPDCQCPEQVSGSKRSSEAVTSFCKYNMGKGNKYTLFEVVCALRPYGSVSFKYSTCF